MKVYIVYDFDKAICVVKTEQKARELISKLEEESVENHVRLCRELSKELNEIPDNTYFYWEDVELIE